MRMRLELIQELRQNINKPRICTNTFAYSAKDDWNTLPNNIKGIKSETISILLVR